MDASLQMSALQLEGYYVTELSFNTRPFPAEPDFILQNGIGVQHGSVYDPDPPTVNVRAAAAQHPEDPLRWQHVLTITSQTPTERKYPYDFRVTLVGYFAVAEQVPAEHRERFVKVNAASILYSAARDLLATVTGRGPLPSVILPTVVFALNPEPEHAAKPKAENQKAGKKAAKTVAKKGAAKKAGRKKQQR